MTPAFQVLLCLCMLGLSLAAPKPAPNREARAADTPCLTEHRESLKFGRPIGRYVPQCDAQGNYTPKQCWSSTGRCWCVDANGGRTTVPTIGSLNCPAHG
ncbi:equistatin-like [Hyla sarda]|uniref:equistatin-like n=1 Tax=Hyla sarda TaxID=327740 RepID=UPI0024C3F602|nr:equistatin-like [Hyla sarda]